MTATKYQLVAYDNKDNGPEDPMVSETIHPFIIPVTITGPQSGRHGEYGALIDSGYTRCLISQVVVIQFLGWPTQRQVPCGKSNPIPHG